VESGLLEQFRCFFGREHVVPVGSGTGGLSLALRCIGVRDRGVLVPALTCPSVPLAVIAAGGVPRAVDLLRADATIDPGAVTDALTADVAAIIAVDSFGYPARIAELRRVAEPLGCPIVEDACQAYGGRIDGEALGALSDVGVVSFGYSKNVWLGAGGLLLTDDRQLAADVLEMQQAPDYRLLSSVRSRMMLKLMLSGHEDWFPTLVRHLGLLRYAFPARQAQTLPVAWRVFVDELPHTLANLKRLAGAAAGIPGVETLEYSAEGWLPWRYSVLVPREEVRVSFAAAMAAAGVPLTHLFPPLTSPFVDLGPDECPEARRISEMIVNFKYPARAADTLAMAQSVEAAVAAWPGVDGATNDHG
jgi:dTDP-4-amino-4,6-dideoxygalactose transaminase